MTTRTGAAAIPCPHGGRRLERRSRGFGLALIALTVLALAIGAPGAAKAQLSELEHVSDTGWRNYMVTTPQGETVIAWQEHVEDPDAIWGYREELWVAVKPPDGPLGEPLLIDANVGECTVQLEVDEDGNVALSFDQDGGVTTVRKPAGEDFEAPLVAPEPPNDGGAGYRMDIADGDIALGFVHFDFEAGERTDTYSAMVSDDGGAYSGPQMLHETAGDGDTGGHDVHLAPGGELTMVWARATDAGGSTTHRIEAVSRSAPGAVGDLQTLASSALPKSCPQVDGDAVGRVALLWLQRGCHEDSLHLALKQPSAPFAAPVTIAAGGFLDYPQLDVTDDGTINVGYSEAGTLTVLTGTFDSPIGPIVGPAGRFNDIGSRDQASSVIAWRDPYRTLVGDVAANGQVTAGAVVPTGWEYDPLVEPLGEDGAAALYRLASGGLWLRTGGFGPLPPIEPPTYPPGGYLGVPELTILDQGPGRQALAKQITRVAQCNRPCQIRANGEVSLRDRNGDRRPFRLEKATVETNGAPATIEIRIPPRVRRLAARQLRDDRRVIARLRLRARSNDGGYANARPSVKLRLPRAG